MDPILTRSAALLFLYTLGGYPPYDLMDADFSDETLAMIVSDVEYGRGMRWFDLVSPMEHTDEPALPRVIGRDEDGPILEGWSQA